MTKTQNPKSRFAFRMLWGYLAANVVLFLVDPCASPWHYGSQDPAPKNVMVPEDSDLSISQITSILDSIDLAYKGREPTALSKKNGQPIESLRSGGDARIAQ